MFNDSFKEESLSEESLSKESLSKESSDQSNAYSSIEIPNQSNSNVDITINNTDTYIIEGTEYNGEYIINSMRQIEKRRAAERLRAREKAALKGSNPEETPANDTKSKDSETKASKKGRKK